jgi:hypothetical protein
VIISGEWLLPIDRPPIRHGAIRISGPRIVDVGELDDLKRRHPKDSVNEQSGCVVLPDS